MATCDMGYEHGEPVAVEAVPVSTGPNENAVKIAAIEAEASVAREEIFADERIIEMQGEIARLRGVVEGMETALAALQPPDPPEPEPVVIPAPVPAPPPDEPAGNVPDVSPPPRSKKNAGWVIGHG